MCQLSTIHCCESRQYTRGFVQFNSRQRQYNEGNKEESEAFVVLFPALPLGEVSEASHCQHGFNNENTHLFWWNKTIKMTLRNNNSETVTWLKLSFNIQSDKKVFLLLFQIAARPQWPKQATTNAKNKLLLYSDITLYGCAGGGRDLLFFRRESHVSHLSEPRLRFLLGVHSDMYIFGLMSTYVHQGLSDGFRDIQPVCVHV